ncbi:hypothetical protein [Prauserella endophytica]|uniref:Uncharacterized protein n=1 Tax=Prauserella endophytica TaxID=1592324 RepID=A0ABY2RZ47_9PSEU|nr:hypothetical protein [Prauserella endophytica]TKG66272.1 hypothetical protein FCN18_25920 [Prauserella endophytica]
MGRLYLVADRLGWHRPVHRRDMSFDCVGASRSRDVIEWTSTFDVRQHANVVQQWMSGIGDVPLSDEWIPAEWLLRVWDSPAMAAAESSGIGMRTRLFEIDAEPVLLARSIPVVIPDLGLAGVDRFQVVREVPNWWLLGPCGREVLALLVQFQSIEIDFSEQLPPSGSELASLRMRAFDLIDAARRVGAYALARAVIGEKGGRFTEFHQLAFGAAVGLVLKDVWPEAPRLYQPWVQRYGLPDLGTIMRHDDLPYPVAWKW